MIISLVQVLTSYSRLSARVKYARSFGACSLSDKTMLNIRNVVLRHEFRVRCKNLMDEKTLLASATLVMQVFNTSW